MHSILSKRKRVRNRKSARKKVSFKKNLVKEIIIPRIGKSKPVNGEKRKTNRKSKRKIINKIISKIPNSK